MRKGLIAVLAVAIIGILGIYGKSHSKSAQGDSTNASAPSEVALGSTSNGVAPTSSNPSNPRFKNGTYTGSTADTSYGPVQIAVVVSGGKITDVNFLQMPNDLGHTQEVTAQSEPILKQETLDTQSANIDFVSGATSTSFGYEQSLQAALDQAKLR